MSVAPTELPEVTALQELELLTELAAAERRPPFGEEVTQWALELALNLSSADP